MRLLTLFEEEDEIGIKDPRAAQQLKQARAKYGWADNDLEAFIAMMKDEQTEQDKDIESQFDVNANQEIEIDDADEKAKKASAIAKQQANINKQQSDALNKLSKKVDKLEKGKTTESITERADPTLQKRIKNTFQDLKYKIKMELDNSIATEMEAMLNKLKLLAKKKGIVLENDIEWQPQPKYRGVGGTSSSYGDAAERQRKMTNVPSTTRRYDREPAKVDPAYATKLNQYWNIYLQRVKKGTPEMKKKLMPILKKIALGAKQKGVTLSPAPEDFGL